MASRFGEGEGEGERKEANRRSPGVVEVTPAEVILFDPLVWNRADALRVSDMNALHFFEMERKLASGPKARAELRQSTEGYAGMSPYRMELEAFCCAVLNDMLGKQEQKQGQGAESVETGFLNTMQPGDRSAEQLVFDAVEAAGAAEAAGELAVRLKSNQNAHEGLEAILAADSDSGSKDEGEGAVPPFTGGVGAANVGQKDNPRRVKWPVYRKTESSGAAGAGQKSNPGRVKRPVYQKTEGSGAAGAGQKSNPGRAKRPVYQKTEGSGAAGAGQKSNPGRAKRPMYGKSKSSGAAGAGQKSIPGRAKRPMYQKTKSSGAAGAASLPNWVAFAKKDGAVRTAGAVKPRSFRGQIIVNPVEFDAKYRWGIFPNIVEGMKQAIWNRLNTGQEQRRARMDADNFVAFVAWWKTNQPSFATLKAKLSEFVAQKAEDILLHFIEFDNSRQHFLDWFMKATFTVEDVQKDVTEEYVSHFSALLFVLQALASSMQDTAKNARSDLSWEELKDAIDIDNLFRGLADFEHFKQPYDHFTKSLTTNKIRYAQDYSEEQLRAVETAVKEGARLG